MPSAKKLFEEETDEIEVGGEKISGFEELIDET
jgi:hypothetical protein